MMNSGCGNTWCFGFLLALSTLVICAGQSPKSTNQETTKLEEPIYDLGPGITPPRVIKQVNPQYSEASHGVRVNGSVSIGVIVTSAGLPKDPHVIRGIDDELDRAAVDALRQWRFAPAQKNDKAIAVRIIIEIEFHSM